MKLDQLTDLYSLISRGAEKIRFRKTSMRLRQAEFNSVTFNQGFTKVAFDTRRIDQANQYNPRRGLQYYNRSEAFITEAMSQKIKNFSKLRHVLNSIKDIYGQEPEWQDSNARVLLTTLDNGLRTIIKDGDFTEAQPGLGSFNYIEELLHVRYRLGFDDLVSMSELDLRQVILAKDEELTRKDVSQSLEITKKDVITKDYDSLIEKLFDGCKASADNPDVERTISITIRDRFHKEG